MFYGVPPSRVDDFKNALSVLGDIYRGQFYAEDMLITLGRNLSFQYDQKFMESYMASVTNDQERSLAWRLHTLTWAAKNALRTEGAFVECGVFKGFCSQVVLKYLDFQDLPRRAYLYDTFAGLPEQTSTAEERETWVSYKQLDPDTLYAQVREKFSGYKNVEVVRGIVPDSFQQAAPEKIAFLHIDMNSEKAEILALEHLFDKVSPGGYIILDDFGWASHANQMRAETAFMQARGHQILELPTGQGMVVKQA